MTPEAFLNMSLTVARLMGTLTLTEQQRDQALAQVAELTSQLEAAKGEREAGNGAPTDPAAATAGILDPVST